MEEFKEEEHSPFIFAILIGRMKSPTPSLMKGPAKRIQISNHLKYPMREICGWMDGG
jgi:hypothetical protein